MSIYSTRPITLTNLHTYPLSSRKSKVNVRDFAKPPAANPSLNKFLASLPNFLAAADLRNLLAAVHTARKQRKAILWGIGGHVIKVGLGPKDGFALLAGSVDNAKPSSVASTATQSNCAFAHTPS